MAYFTLIVRRRPVDGDTQPSMMQWGVEFGDYDRDCVAFEQIEFRATNGREFLTKIIRTKSARQSDIDAAVAAENAKLG